MAKMKLIKWLFLLFFSGLISTSLKSQDLIPAEGAYRNPADFIKGKLLYEHSFVFEKIGDGRFPRSYSVSSKNSKIKENDIKYGIWAIYAFGHLYVNSLRHALKPGFIKVKYTGNYLYLKASPMLTQFEIQKSGEAAFNFGLTGVIYQEAQRAKQNKGKTHYVLNIKKGTTNLLTKEYVRRILLADEDLLKKFMEEPDLNNVVVLSKYLELINEKGIVR